MDTDSTALVVVDVQNGFVNERSRHIVPVIAQLVDRWSSIGGAVVFTRYLNYSGSMYEQLMHWSRLQQSPEIDIVPELAERAKKGTAVIDKTGYTLFNSEGAELVQERAWKNMAFCGIATESCVLKSAVDAFERNITPWILVDACASHAGDTAHQAGLLVAGRFIGGGQLIPSQQLVDPQPLSRAIA